MVLEAVGGWYVGSLAVMSDAAHLLVDCAGFAMNLVGLYVAQRPKTLKYTYGYQRAEIVGAIMSVLLLWLLTGIILYQAVRRLFHPEDVKGMEMFAIASCGLGVNVIMGVILAQSGHGHSHGLPGQECSHGGHDADEEDPQPSHSHTHSHSHSHGHGHSPLHAQSSHANYHSLDQDPDMGRKAKATKKQSMAVRSAFLHVLGDGIQSVGVMIAAGLIWYKPEWKIADPICSCLFALIVLATTPKILKQGLGILMNAAPTNMSRQMYTELYSVECIKDVHDLHLWPLTSSGKLALTVHLVATDKVKALKMAQIIAMKMGVRHTTIQVECGDEVSNCAKVNTHQCVMDEAESLQALSAANSEDEDAECEHHHHHHEH